MGILWRQGDFVIIYNWPMTVLPFVPLYAGLSVLVLIGVMFAVDKDTPHSVFVFLMCMYLGLLLYYWRQPK